MPLGLRLRLGSQPLVLSGARRAKNWRCGDAARLAFFIDFIRDPLAQVLSDVRLQKGFEDKEYGFGRVFGPIPVGKILLAVDTFP